MFLEESWLVDSLRLGSFHLVGVRFVPSRYLWVIGVKGLDGGGVKGEHSVGSQVGGDRNRPGLE